MRKTKRILTFDASKVKVKDVIMKGDGATLEEKLAAMIILKRTIAKATEGVSSLKAVLANFEGMVESTTYKKHCDDLKAAGKLNPEWGETPVFEITTGDGATHTVRIKGEIDNRFEIDKGLTAKSILDTLPDEYKTITTSLNKTAIKDRFYEGTLPATLKSFCSEAPVEITKLSFSLAKSTGTDTTSDEEE